MPTKSSLTKPTATKPVAPRAAKTVAAAQVAPVAVAEPVRAPAPAPRAAIAAPKAAPAAPKAAPAKSKVLKASEQRAVLARRASVMLKFVSDPTRLQVILFLAEAEHHVGALCTQLGQTQPAVSHHLALLRHGGIISPRRMGKNNFYSLSDTGTELAKVVKLLLQVA